MYSAYAAARLSFFFTRIRLWSFVLLDVPAETLAPIERADLLPADLPGVLLTGSADDRSPPAETQDIGRRIPRLVRYIEFPGAGHVALSIADPPRYSQAVALLLAAAAK